MPKWQYQPVTTHADHSFDFVGVAAPSPFKLFIIQLFFIIAVPRSTFIRWLPLFYRRWQKQKDRFTNDA
ncbi:hypothetical protein Q9R34_03360 [Enterobacter sp. BRE11]|nr:hypothetical protein [Enterobacter sp. BRE11]